MPVPAPRLEPAFLQSIGGTSAMAGASSKMPANDAPACGDVAERIGEVIDMVSSGFFEQGLTVAQILGIDKRELEALYTLGSKKYESGEYKAAQDIFVMLCRIDPLSGRNFRALGAAFQMERKYDRALKAYAAAVSIDLDDAASSLHAGECLLLLGKSPEARAALEGCLMQAAQDPERYADVRARAQALLAKAGSKPKGKGK